MNKDMLIILEECLKSHRPDLLWVLENTEVIDEKLGNELRSVVNAVLIEKGLNENDEPNDLGIKLENLIDKLGRFFM